MNTNYTINKELGECYLFMGELEKAENYYILAVESDSNQPDAYLGLATVAIQRNDLKQAELYYDKALSLAETDKTLAGMGLVKMEMGEHLAAFTYFKKACQLNLENSVALNCLVKEGYNLELLPEVIEILYLAIEVNPYKDETRTSLAGCLVSLGRSEEAIAQLQTILTKNPTHPLAKELYDYLAA